MTISRPRGEKHQKQQASTSTQQLFDAEGHTTKKMLMNFFKSAKQITGSTPFSTNSTSFTVVSAQPKATASRLITCGSGYAT